MPLHPLVVHFPIALLIMAGVFYLVEVIVQNDKFGFPGFILHALGLLGTIVAIFSGDVAEGGVIHTHEINELLDLHENLGMLSAWAFGSLAVWVFLRKQSKILIEKIGFLIVYAGLIGVLAWTSHIGGTMVYEHGAGVAPMEQPLLKQLQKEQQ